MHSLAAKRLALPFLSSFRPPFPSFASIRSYESGKKWTKEHVSEDSAVTLNYMAAGFAFFVSCIFVVPGEFLKQEVQMDHFHSVAQGIQETIRAGGGWEAFFEGWDGVLARGVPYTMLELGVYDQIKNTYKAQFGLSSLQAWEEVVAAAITGGIAGYLTTPFDTIKTKLVVDTYDGGFMECLLTTVHDHGVAALFAGGIARVLWLLPFNAIHLPLFDALKRYFAKQQQQVQQQQEEMESR